MKYLISFCFCFLIYFCLAQTPAPACFPLLASESGYGPGVSLSCQNNIFTPNAPSIPQDFLDNNTRSVFMMEIEDPSNGDLITCSCTLLRKAFTNNDDNQQENIFITSRHCIVQKAINPSNGSNNANDIANAKFIFNYSNADGATTSPIGCKVSRYVITGGATVLDVDFIDDIAVLKLNNPIPPHFKPFYSGWTAGQQIIASNWFNIHHPSGDIKKINQTQTPFAQELLIPPRYTVQWVNGRTEGGSSGSGLFNFNRRLIGVLSGEILPGTGCFGSQTANFGKFKDFWFNIGNTATRNALNPNNVIGLTGVEGGEIDSYSGPIYLDGIYWPAGDYQPTNIVTIKCGGDMFLAHSGLPLTIKTGAEFTFEAGGQVIKALPGFYAELGSTVIIKQNMSCTAMRMAYSFTQRI